MTTLKTMGSMTYTDDYFWMERSADMVGRGSFGQVHKGRNMETGAFVAIKTCPRDMGDAKQHRDEVSLLSTLNSPYIVKFIAEQVIKGSSGRTALIMEMADGNLRDELLKPENYFGLPYQMLLRIISHLERGLSYLNSKNVAHRDIKPANILIFNGQSETTFKLCDFGGSRFVVDPAQPLFSLVGTPGYLNECTTANVISRGGVMPYTKDECDLWSVGCTIFECATGRLPFVPANGFSDTAGMFNMISSRPADVIWGDVDRRDGAFIWGREFPQNRCSYPKSLQRVLCEFLRRLFDRHDSTRLTFQKFSEMCIELTSLKTFRLFNVNKLSVQDYFDTSSSVHFERISFDEEMLADLPPHSLACLLTLPARTAVTPFSQFFRSAADKLSDVAVMAFEKQNGAYILPVIEPMPSTSSVPLLDDLRHSGHALKFAVASVLRLEKQIEAVWSFVENIATFCRIFLSAVNKAVGSLASEVNVSRRVSTAVHLQSAALSLGRPTDEKNAIENNARLVANEIYGNEQFANKISGQVAKIKNMIEQLAEMEIPKFLSQREALEVVLKNRTIHSAAHLPQNDLLVVTDCRLVLSSVENAIKRHKENSNAVHGILESLIDVILRNLFDVSEEIGRAKKQLDETMQLIAVAEHTNKERILITQNGCSADSVRRYSEISAMLEKAAMEAKAQRREAEESLERTKKEVLQML